MALRTLLWSQLSSPRAARLVVGAALALTLGSLFNGIALDDHFHVAMVRGYAQIERAPWDLYRFISGEPTEMQRLISSGLLPWWSHLEARTAFFRPLSSLSVWVDYAVLPHWPFLFHLENLALYTALVALVLALHRKVIADGALAALAALLFAIDDGHGIAVGWLANRNALFAAVCSLGAVLWHRRAVEGSALHRLLAPAALAAGLGFGETALGGAAYVIAWAATMDQRPLHRRGLSLLPYALVLAAWATIVRALGFGVHGSDFYVDPIDAPLRFARSFPGWLTALASSQFLGAPAADLWFVWTAVPRPAALIALTVALLALGLFGRAVWPLLQRERGARFFALGACLCVGLSTATVPADRNLLLAGVGAFGLMALFIGSLVDAPPAPRSQRWLRRWLIATHLVLAPVMLLAGALAPGLMDGFLRGGTREAGRSAAPASTLVVVNATNIVMNAFYLGTPERAGDPIPAALLTLSPSMSSAVLHREDAHTLVLRLKPGWVREPTGALTRDSDHPLRAGDAVRAAGAQLTVLDTDERGRLQQLRVAFEVPLDDPSLRWVRWDGRALVPFELPAVGSELSVE